MYPLVNMVVMALCTVLSGADDFVSIARWAEKKKEWLATFLDMSAGVPSHDRSGAVLGALKPTEFEKCLLSWITAVHKITDGQVIAIDGKTLRGSFDAASSKAAIHMVSASCDGQPRELGASRDRRVCRMGRRSAANPSGGWSREYPWVRRGRRTHATRLLRTAPPMSRANEAIGFPC